MYTDLILIGFWTLFKPTDFWRQHTWQQTGWCKMFMKTNSTNLTSCTVKNTPGSPSISYALTEATQAIPHNAVYNAAQTFIFLDLLGWFLI